VGAEFPETWMSNQRCLNSLEGSAVVVVAGMSSSNQLLELVVEEGS